MAAKLVVSTIADVRNTMFMSGITAFPRAHWSALGPAMKRQAELHRQVAGHTPRGPFKHYWGEAARLVGDDNPYSLFLALGVPFEVTDALEGRGWTFLADADAETLAAGVDRKEIVVRPQARAADDRARKVPETLPDLFAFRREILPQLGETPHVVEEKPVVCAWYPTTGSVLLWNLSEQAEAVTLHCGAKTIPVTLEPLGAELARC